MQKNLFDRRKMRRQAQKIPYHRIKTLIQPVINEMRLRLALIPRRFENGLFIGHYSDKHNPFTDHINNLLFADIVRLKNTTPTRPAILLDEEALPFEDNCFDCVINCLTLHSVNDVPRALNEMRRILKPDGFFLSLLPSGDAFHQLRHTLIEAETAIFGGAYARVPPFATLYDLSLILQKIGFALPVADRDKITLHHKSANSLMRDIRLWGWMSAFPQPKPIRHNVLRLFKEQYQQQYAKKDGMITTECELAWLSGWKPDQTQPKPLKPGSAQVSLASVLEKPKKSS